MQFYADTDTNKKYLCKLVKQETKLLFFIVSIVQFSAVKRDNILLTLDIYIYENYILPVVNTLLYEHMYPHEPVCFTSLS